MRPHAAAAGRATIAIVIGGLLMSVPAVNVLLLIFVMLPLWIVNDLDVPGLGQPLNGFFVPSAIGWCVLAAIFRGISYVLSLGALKSASGR